MQLLSEYSMKLIHVILKPISRIDISDECGDRMDDQSTLVQVKAWCCQATCHYRNQC